MCNEYEVVTVPLDSSYKLQSTLVTQMSLQKGWRLHTVLTTEFNYELIFEREIGCGKLNA